MRILAVLLMLLVVAGCSGTGLENKRILDAGEECIDYSYKKLGECRPGTICCWAPCKETPAGMCLDPGPGVCVQGPTCN
jgi:hypothetical protein